MVVIISGHPPLLVADLASGPEPGSWARYLHASLWLNVDLDDWGVRRSGHLHLVRPDDEGEWRPVDLARHPLRPRPDVTAATVDELTPLLLDGLEALDLRFFRIAELGLVSEMGEGRDEFRRRALGLFRGEVQTRVDAISSRSAPRMPWRRRVEERQRAAARSQIAGGLARLAASIEERAVPDAAEVVGRVELGILLVPEGVRLTPPLHRDLMI